MSSRTSDGREVSYGVFVPNFGPFGDPRVLVDLARQAEKAGWDGFFIWDHILLDSVGQPDMVDPWIVLTAVAMATSRIRFGALITPLARRRPGKVARETATLDRLSGGRLILGVGLGFPADAEFGLFGEETDDRVRAEKLDEALEVIDGLWSGDIVEFTGRHYSIGPVRFSPTPVQRPRPPVWVAGWWPNKRPFRRAARWDGMFPEMVAGAIPTVADLRDICDYVGALRGENDEPFDVVLTGYSDTSDPSSLQQVADYVDVGLTWWLERISPSRLFSVEETSARIANGPPIT